MALPSTIFKVQLQVSDLDRHYYGEHLLTLARHPSETDERLMVRLLAFALHAGEGLAFTRGLCVDEEPALWLQDPTGAVELWLEVGLPDERRLRKACGRARQVVVYAYGGRAGAPWWQRSAAALGRLANLRVVELPEAQSRALAGLARRSLQLQLTIQEGTVWLAAGEQTLALTPVVLKG